MYLICLEALGWFLIAVKFYTVSVGIWVAHACTTQYYHSGLWELVAYLLHCVLEVT